MTPVKIGLIGYRGFGAFCTEAYHQKTSGRVVAYAGRDAEAMAKTARQYDVPRTYTNWQELIADPMVELVHIVTPPDQHAAMAIAALQAGKHVLIEKPLAVTNKEAQEILQAAHQAHRLAGINYVMRYDPLYQAVKKVAESGWLGSLTHVGFENYASDEGLGDDHWFWDNHASGGIFVEHGVHFFDVIGDIIGAPARQVLGQTWTRSDGTDKQDRVQASVTYESGVDASFYHAFNRPGALEKQSAHFAFERGHITLEGWIPTTLYLKAIITEDALASLQNLFPTLEIVQDHPHQVRGHGRDYLVRYHVTAVERIGGPTEVYRSAVCNALQDLALAIRDPQHRLTVSAKDGATSLRVALAAKQSAQTGVVEQI
jgi:predicted dehydrogenase